MLKLDTPIQYLKGVGPKLAPKLNKLGISSIQDLLYYFPRTWQDFTKITLISQLRMGQEVIIQGSITQIKNSHTPRRKMVITTAIVEDRVGDTIKLVWFSQPFLTQNLHIGEEWIFGGKVEYNWQLKEKTIHSPIYEKKSQILPIYSETQGITSKYLRRLIQNVLTPLSIPDFLPDQIINSEKLLSLSQAINQIHFPDTNHLLARAKYRLAFDELFLIILKMQLAKLDMQNQRAPKIGISKDLLVKFTKSLPYQLTNAQRRASWEIIQDMNRSYPMNRLLNGDVGSGKTIVALMAALNCASNNLQVAWMAPTEILARQHYETSCKLLEPFAVKIGLLTSSEARISKSQINSKSQIQNKSKIINLKSKIINADIVIGTHALIQDKISFPNLGLVIIDEQHRFGVKQRAALQRGMTQNEDKSRNYAEKISVNLRDHQRQSASIPHFLSMTATPIPRTLALSIYGDLDISILDEMPVGRKPIITRLVNPTNRQKAYDFIRQQIKKGRQAFVICPLIGDQKSETGDWKSEIRTLFNLEHKSVKKEYEKLSKDIFPDLKIVMLHGRMKSKEKEQIMQDFREGKHDLIVSTSVVEVGVDIPNATIMMIEDAERFGLAQLHQFRGRVGRGEHQSYCLLFTSSLSPDTNKRLQALVESNDGFKLAQCDLVLRGPGQLTGINQSGAINLKIADLTDILMISKIRNQVKTLLQQNMRNFPQLLEKIHQEQPTSHLE